MQRNTVFGLAGLGLIILGFALLAFASFSTSATKATPTLQYDRELFYLTKGGSGALAMAYPAFGPGSLFQGAKEVEVVVVEGAVGINYTVVINGSATQAATTKEVTPLNITLVNNGKTDMIMYSTAGDFGPTFVFLNWPTGWNKIDNIQISSPSNSSAVVSATAYVIYGASSNGQNQALYVAGAAVAAVGIALTALSLYLKGGCKNQTGT